MWNYVIPHFTRFLEEIELDPAERADGERKALRVAKSLFADYYPGQTFDPRCYAIVGSYRKGTATKPRSDIDMIFVLPDAEFPRINGLSNNKQSQLLQEVKYSLLETYPNTEIRGDGPVVKVPFSSYYFEVVPVFRLNEGSFINAHTKRGGFWGFTNPAAEINWLQQCDSRSLGKGTHLVKMLKAWKRECNVEIRSVCLEILATLFINQWMFRHQTIYFYDWMVRDFFEFMLRFANDGWTKPAGIDEQIMLGDCWLSKCQSAYSRAVKACEYERADESTNAIGEWRKVFGTQFKYDAIVEAYLTSLRAPVALNAPSYR